MYWPSVLPAFLASMVEFVEALTIVLAVGVTINWRTSLWGAAAAFTVLALFVAVFGAAIIIYIPIDLLRMMIGIILILFGLQWLKKSVLRYSGVKELHDEAAIYQRKVMALQAAGTAGAKDIFDRLGFLTSFKSVLLEGLEVVFIVITFGSTAGMNKTAGLLSASCGALLALVLVVCAGAAVRRPLTRIPENTLKFIVGIMLVTFGTFWAGEGCGILWPLQDGFLFGLAAIYLAMCAGLTVWLRGRPGESN
ncbi:MAG: hypothetical protein FWC60_02810 [Firmicutes bacterium]|nr:hypothetical protein [Bacillota bacterium]